MTGELFINGKDAWINWRVRLIEDSYDNLLLSANPKKYVENKNRSEHGTRLLVLNPRLDERNIQLMFAITCDSRDEYLERYESLVNELNNGWVELESTHLKKVYNIIEPEFLNLGTGIGIKEGKLSVRFREPNPDNRLNLKFYNVWGTEKGEVVMTEDKKNAII